MKADFTQIKKFLAVSIHLFSLAMVIASICILYANANFGRGLTWIQSETYVQSELFITSCSPIFGQFLTMPAFRMPLKPTGKSI